MAVRRRRLRLLGVRDRLPQLLGSWLLLDSLLWCCKWCEGTVVYGGGGWWFGAVRYIYPSDALDRFVSSPSYSGEGGEKQRAGGMDIFSPRLGFGIRHVVPIDPLRSTD